MSVTVQCYVGPQSRRYADGLEIVEAYVPRNWERLIPKPPAGQRVPIILITETGRYVAGLRTYPKQEWIYICLDLRAVPCGTKISLARLLQEYGYKPKDYVDFTVEEGIWELKTNQ
jgi:hypothetical protein